MQVHPNSLLTLIILVVIALPFFGLLDRQARIGAYRLFGKTVLITGGSRGLGLVMARQLVAAGAQVALCARDAAELQRAKAELEQRGGTVFALTCDVTHQAQVDQMIQQVRDHFGSIDILINNAGADIVGPVETLTTQDYDDLMKLHFWAPLYTTYAVLPEMQHRQSGRIVNISSIGGKVPSPHMVGYCASKFALVGFSEGMRTELAKDGIAVTTVCPGFIRTGVIDHAIVKGQNQKEFAWFSISDSLPFISASAEAVAQATLSGLRRGAAEVIVPFPTWLAIKFYGLFPGLSTRLFSVFNRLLPRPGGIGQQRADGQDSRSAWSPTWLTQLSDRAAQRNNELPITKSKSVSESVSVVEPVNSEGSLPDAVVGEWSQTELAEDSQSAFPLVNVDQAPPEIQLCLNHIQDTLGIPWKPTNWRAYAMYPNVLRLFWQRLKPATQTEAFLEDAIAITEQVYQDVNDWYQPDYQTNLDRGAQRQIQRTLDALSFGNAQLLIQQLALSKALAGEIVGEHGSGEMRRGSHPHRHPEMQLIGERSAQALSAEMQQIYRDIQQTLGAPLVSADYQALARWSAFFMAAWEDVKVWRDRPEYQLLQQSILQSAEKAASRLCPAVVIGEQEVRDSLDYPADFEQVQQTVELFTDILPELIIQDALFRLGLANRQPAALDDVVNSL